MSDDVESPQDAVSRGEFLRRAGVAVAGASALSGLALAAGSSAASAAGLGEARRAPPQHVHKQSLLYTVLSRGKLIVGTHTGNPPWHFSNASGRLEGMDIAMGQILAQGLFNDASAVEFTMETADARIPNLLTGKVDVVIQFMTVSPQRAQQVEFSIPYYREGVHLLITKRSRFQTYEAALKAGKNMRVSVLLNTSAVQLVHEVLPNATVLQLDSQANVIQAVVSGKVDAADVDASTVAWLSKTHPAEFLGLGPKYYPQTYAAAVLPGDPIWLNFINTTFHEAMTGINFPTYSAAFETYFGGQLKSPTVGFPMEYAPDTTDP